MSSRCAVALPKKQRLSDDPYIIKMKGWGVCFVAREPAKDRVSNYIVWLNLNLSALNFRCLTPRERCYIKPIDRHFPNLEAIGRGYNYVIGNPLNPVNKKYKKINFKISKIVFLLFGQRSDPGLVQPIFSMSGLNEAGECIEGFGYQIDEGGIAETKMEEIFHHDQQKILEKAEKSTKVLQNKIPKFSRKKLAIFRESSAGH